MEGQELPEPLAQYQLNPSQNSKDITEEETEARKQLAELGIMDEQFKQAYGKDSRSNITGTYRIILHKIHKRLINADEFPEENHVEQYNNINNRNRDNHIQPKISLQKKESKMCTIL